MVFRSIDFHFKKKQHFFRCISLRHMSALNHSMFITQLFVQKLSDALRNLPPFYIAASAK